MWRLLGPHIPAAHPLFPKHHLSQALLLNSQELPDPQLATLASMEEPFKSEKEGKEEEGFFCFVFLLGISMNCVTKLILPQTCPVWDL